MWTLLSNEPCSESCHPEVILSLQYIYWKCVVCPFVLQIQWYHVITLLPLVLHDHFVRTLANCDDESLKEAHQFG